MTDAGAALFVGDIGLDTTMTVSHVPEPDEKLFASGVVDSSGGVVANAAVACRRAGAAVRLLCRTGRDVAGDQVVLDIRNSGVHVDARSATGATCRSFIVLEPTGEKRLILIPGVSMYPDVEQIRAVPLSAVAWVHTAAYDHAAAALLAARCRKANVPWSVDLEPATFDRDPASLGAVLQGAAVVFANARAAQQLGHDPAGWLFEHGAQAVVLSQGSQGAEWLTPTRRAVVPPPGSVGAVLDTTGAGDCLAGWFIAETLSGSAPIEALGMAVHAATLSCTRLGAQASYPDRDELHRLRPASHR